MVSVSVHREDRWCVRRFFLKLGKQSSFRSCWFFFFLLTIVSAMVNDVQRAARGYICQKEYSHAGSEGQIQAWFLVQECP